MGELAYNTYCTMRGWLSFRGELLPLFDEQDPDIKEAWCAAASAVCGYVMIDESYVMIDESEDELV